MKRSNLISSSKRRNNRRNERNNNNNKVEQELDQTQNQIYPANDKINFMTDHPSTSILPGKFYGSDDIAAYPFDSSLSWRVPAILGVVWTAVLILVVLLFIIRKTVFSSESNSDQHRAPETNPENEWMIASFDEDVDDVIVPLSTGVSRD